MQKRINTRIFQLGGKVPDNPAPGTVLDHTVGGIIAGFIIIAHMCNSQVTKRDWYDFFLVSQHVGQGTVSPTHYIVVHDNTGLKPDIIQKVSLYCIARIGLEAFHLNPDQLQADSHVLQLAGHSESASAMSIRSQACLPGPRTT